MVWPPILMECSVTEDSSFGGGGVGSADFFSSAAFASFSWAQTGRASRDASASASALRCRRFIIVDAPDKRVWSFGRMNLYTGAQGMSKERANGLALRHDKGRRKAGASGTA